MPDTINLHDCNMNVVDTSEYLSKEVIDSYYKFGYVIIPSLLSVDYIDSLMSASKIQNSEGDKWNGSSLDISKPIEDLSLHQILVHPTILNLAEVYLEQPVRVHFGMLAIIAANGGNGLPWHQDNMYTKLLGKAMNIFIALCDITPKMGTLWIAPKSHIHGVLDYRINTTTAPGHREVTEAPKDSFCVGGLNKGDAVVFDRQTLHRSLTNSSQMDRYAYAAQYSSVNVRNAEDGMVMHEKILARDLLASYVKSESYIQPN